jgi:hypothetical protein
MGSTIAQKAYEKFFNAAIEGGLYDISEFLDIITKNNVTDAGGTPFGCLVVDVAGQDTGVKLPSSSGEIVYPTVEGIAMFTQLIENGDAFATSLSVYEANSPINVLHKGRIWVKPEESVAVGDDVYVRVTAGSASGTTQVGKFRKSSDSAKAVLVPNAKWFKGRDANWFAVLEVNF